jgi:hypothetical protein
MKNIVHIASAAAILLGIGAAGQGCVLTNCHDETDPDTGKTKQVCDVETLQGYRGSDVNNTLTYTAGMNITINSQNGDVTLKTGSAGTVGVTFKPFTARPGGEDEEAKIEMTEDIVYTASDDGSIQIGVAKKSGSSSGLGADIVVSLPAGYDGAVSITQNNGEVKGTLAAGVATATSIDLNNGSLDVSGVSGVLNIAQGNGIDCNVGISSWGVGSGSVSCDSINAVIAVKSGLTGSLQLQANGGVISETGLPTDWTASPENQENSKSFSFGADPASTGNVLMTNDGDIDLIVN